MLQAVQQVWLGKEESSHSEKAIPGHLPSWAVNLPDCRCRRWTASARWLSSGLLWGSWKHRNPSRESRAAFHLAAVQLLCHHLTGHLSHLINFLFFFARNQLSIFLWEIWGSFRCVSCLPLNACDTCLWPLARLSVLQQLRWCQETATRRQCFRSLVLCLDRLHYSFQGYILFYAKAWGIIHRLRKNTSRELEKKGQAVQFSVI